MKLLPDENLPKRLKQDLSEHEIYTASEKGWTGVSNGKLPELLIEHKFDALLTFDKNLQYQLIVLNATDNSYIIIKALVPKIKDVLQRTLKPGPNEVMG